MDEHERTARAARQVDLRIGFYIHLLAFLLVCVGLVAINWFTTPNIWWAQWPFLGWGIGVLGHALCAFTGGGPNIISRWRLRKIRELSHPEAVAIGNSRAAGAGRTIGILLLAIIIGCAAGGGYAFTLLQRAREDTRTVAASRDALDRSFKGQEAQLETSDGGKIRSRENIERGRRTAPENAS